MTTVRDRISVLDTAISEIADRAARAAEHLARLDEKIVKAERRLARGTFQGEQLPVAEETVPAHPRARSKRDTIPTPPPAPIGQDAPPAARYAILEDLLSFRPMTNQELLEATGLTTAQISTTLVNMQRRGMHVVNLGDARKARWFLASRPI